VSFQLFLTGTSSREFAFEGFAEKDRNMETLSSFQNVLALASKQPKRMRNQEELGPSPLLQIVGEPGGAAALIEYFRRQTINESRDDEPEMYDMRSQRRKYKNTIDATADIVSAYVAKNPVTLEQLTRLIFWVHSSVRSLPLREAPQPQPKQVHHKPNAIQIRRSITPNALISFENGKRYKSLKRHLTWQGLTPHDYRSKWGLPPDYPMTSSDYSERRSKIAKSFGLGVRRTSSKSFQNIS
jgi:predicted transcriptional regulator